MTPVTTFAGKNVALFGLGGSGLATARALLAGGAHVAAFDDHAAGREKAAAQSIDIVDLATADWRTFDALVLTPGVPLTHPAPHWAAVLAQAAGVEIIGDIELFCRERALVAPNAAFVAITGTNGKSTTTALIAHLLRHAGHDVAMGGNIGTAILDLPPPAEGRVHVIECSSFQIDLAPSLQPSIGVLINITPDHLDRHGSLEQYAAIKARLATGATCAFVGIDDALSAAIAKSCGATPVSVQKHLQEGIFADGPVIFEISAGDDARVLGDLTGISALRGRHNAQNASFAAGVVAKLGLTSAQIQQGLATFPGLAHRMEIIGHAGKVLFVNDSKATNADSTQKALLSFEDIFWIVGGKAKEGGISALRTLYGKIVKAYLIGASSDQFAAELEGRVPFECCGTLAIATSAAARDAAASLAPEPVVLLSPACASYDQFPNFEVRGDRFRDFCRTLDVR